MKVIAIVQARMGSTRLPNKVMKKIGNTPMIEILLKRLSNSKLIDKIVLATSIDLRNKILINHVNSIGFNCEQGSDTDVLARYIDTAEKYKAENIVRITGDCPLVDPNLVDICIKKFEETDVDYYSNTIIWNKGKMSMGDLSSYGNNYEMALFCSQGKPKLKGERKKVRVCVQSKISFCKCECVKS